VKNANSLTLRRMLAIVLTALLPISGHAYEIEPYVGFIIQGKSHTAFVEKDPSNSWESSYQGDGHTYGNSLGLRIGFDFHRLVGLGYQYERGDITIVTRTGTVSDLWSTLYEASFGDVYKRTLHGPLLYCRLMPGFQVGAAYYFSSMEDISGDYGLYGAHTNRGDKLKGDGYGTFLRAKFGHTQVSLEYRKFKMNEFTDATPPPTGGTFRFGELRWSETFLSISFPIPIFGRSSAQSIL